MAQNKHHENKATNRAAGPCKKCEACRQQGQKYIKTGDYDSNVCSKKKVKSAEDSLEKPKGLAVAIGKGCCALFKKCNKLSAINHSGHTCIKGTYCNAQIKRV